MKISTREIILLTVLLLMLLSGAYYMFYYVPNTEEINSLQEKINSKTTQIDNASITLLRRQSLALKKEALEEEFADVEKHLDEDFYDADILRQIERIITPYTEIMTIEFDNKKPAANDAEKLTTVRTVQVSMNTTYDDLQAIIKTFAKEDAANRIVSFACSSHHDEFSIADNREMRVSFAVDFLMR